MIRIALSKRRAKFLVSAYSNNAPGAAHTKPFTAGLLRWSGLPSSFFKLVECLLTRCVASQSARSRSRLSLLMRRTRHVVAFLPSFTNLLTFSPIEGAVRSSYYSPCAYSGRRDGSFLQSSSRHSSFTGDRV